MRNATVHVKMKRAYPHNGGFKFELRIAAYYIHANSKNIPIEKPPHITHGTCLQPAVAPWPGPSVDAMEDGGFRS
jgi:hypothetical protein